MTRFAPLALIATLVTAPAFAEAENYTLDASHSQIVFSYNHLGFSTSYGMFSGFNGEILFDQADPAASSVTVSFPVKTMLTGWQERFDHFMSADFFDAADDEMVTFTSTAIEVTGEKTAKITGDLSLNGVTKSVVLDAVMNQVGEHPMAKTPWAGFSATTTLIRSDYNLGQFAPYVSDEVQVQIRKAARDCPARPFPFGAGLSCVWWSTSRGSQRQSPPSPHRCSPHQCQSCVDQASGGRSSQLCRR
jgi:polyisoprenoid-binding protein YceI